MGTVLDRRGFLKGAAATGAGLGLAGAAAGPASAAGRAPAHLASQHLIDVQLVNITDLHGYLQPEGINPVKAQDGSMLTVGGAGYLTTHIRQLRAGRRNSILFSTGDNFTGWQHDGFWFRGEPVVEYLNHLGLEFSASGNHEFDERPEQLVEHMIKGRSGGILGKAGVDVDFINSEGRRYDGAHWTYSSANLIQHSDRSTVLPPYVIKRVTNAHGATARIGFINLTVPDTVLPTYLSFNPSLRGLDHVPTAERYVKLLKAKGVHAIVANIHDGGVQLAGPGDWYDGFAELDPDPTRSGQALDFAKRVTPDIDLIVTGHQHHAWKSMIPDPDGNPRLVMEAGCYGQLIGDIALSIDSRTGRIDRDSIVAHNRPNTRDVVPDRKSVRIADYWTEKMAERDRTHLVEITGDITATANCCGESTLGDLVADMELWQGKQEPGRPAVIALARTRTTTPTKTSDLPPDMLYAASTTTLDDAPGRVLFGEATGDPYGKSVPVVNADLTGADITQMLEEQWSVVAGKEIFCPLAVSANVSYSYDSRKPLGQRVDAASIMIDGKPIVATKTYRVSAVNTVFTGSPYADDANYPAGKNATRYYRQPLEDRFAWVDWLRDQRVVTPPALTRVTDVAQVADDNG